MDHPAQTYRLIGEVLARLSRDEPITGLDDRVREDYVAAAYFLRAMLSVFLSDDSALRAAHELDRRGPLYELSAEHIRTMYYASRGDLNQADHCRRKLGVKAIQLGSAWRVDAIAPALIMPAFMGLDAVSLKRTAEQLERMVQTVPSANSHLRASRAAHLLLRGKALDAVQLLDTEDDDNVSALPVGWCRTRGLLACGLNMIEQHERARDVCNHALSLLSEDDQEFVGMNVSLPVELSLAEAALGDVRAAAMRLDALIARHEPRRAPLLLAYLHRARARVSLTAADMYSARQHVAAMEDWTKRTRLPSLRGALSELKAQVAQGQRPSERDGFGLEGDSLSQRTQSLLISHSVLEPERARCALRAAVDLTGADHGHLVFADALEPSVNLETERPAPELAQWARACLSRAEECAATVVEGSGSAPSGEAPVDETLHLLDDVHYCLTPVWGMRDGREVPIAALVLGYEGRSANPLAGETLRLVAEYLDDSVTSRDVYATMPMSSERS